MSKRMSVQIAEWMRVHNPTLCTGVHMNMSSSHLGVGRVAAARIAAIAGNTLTGNKQLLRATNP